MDHQDGAKVSMELLKANRSAMVPSEGFGGVGGLEKGVCRSRQLDGRRCSGSRVGSGSITNLCRSSGAGACTQCVVDSGDVKGFEFDAFSHE